MAYKEDNSGCIVLVIGIIIGTIIFNGIYTDKIWERVMNAPVETGAMMNSIGFWIILCIASTWLVGKLWAYLKK